MATTTIVISDTADGRIETHCDYHPKRGERCTLAQQATLEILARTRKEYGLVGPEPEPMPACPNCGSNNQVWPNQITGQLTCHRAHCHTEVAPKQTKDPA